MSDCLYVGTRKGLFTLQRDDDAHWTISNTDFLGDPVSMLLPDQRDDSLYACLNLGHFGTKLHHRATDSDSWRECTAPAYPADSGDDASVELLWSLEAGGADQPGRLWCGTIPGGLFRSDDYGRNWRLCESLWNDPKRAEWFGGGYDQPGIHSICVHPHDSRRIVVGVSVGGVWRSEDDGDSWTLIGEGLGAAYVPPERKYDRNLQDPHRLLACPGDPDKLWIQHHNGIFRSIDGGEHWEEITAAQPSAFGFALAVHPINPDTAWFVPAVKDECRVPVDGKLVVSRTRNGGASFTVLREGLPQTHSYDLVYRHALDIDSSGTRLAFGSTTGGLWVSENSGERWSHVCAHLPPIACVRFG